MEDDIIIKKSLKSKFWAWFYNDPWVEEEQQYWLQMARRQKLVTDIQEKRIQHKLKKIELKNSSIDVDLAMIREWKGVEDRKKKYEVFVGRFLYGVKYQTHGNVLVTVRLFENGSGMRLCRLTDIRKRENSACVKDSVNNAETFKFIQSRKPFWKIIQPWLDRQISTEKMKELALRDFPREFDFAYTD